MSAEPNTRPTRLSRRDLDADRVYGVMCIHADAIASVCDVLRLPALRDVNGERIAVALADLVAQGRVVGACGTGRIRAVKDREAAERR